jgi:hypothetical protein
MTPLSRRQLVALALFAVGAAGCASGGSTDDTTGDTTDDTTSSPSAELTGIQFDVHRDPG